MEYRAEYSKAKIPTNVLPTASDAKPFASLVHDPMKAAQWYREKLDFEVVRIEGHTVYVKPKGGVEHSPAPLRAVRLPGEGPAGRAHGSLAPVR